MFRSLPVAVFALAAASPLALIWLGAAWGGGWGWAALAVMALAVVALDLALPGAAGTAEAGAEFPGADALLVTLALGALATLSLLVAVLIPLRPGGLAAACAAGLWLGQVAHPAAHELIHRPGRAARALGVAVYVALLMGHHASAHRLVHHIHVATPRDPNTARAGESFWHFAPRAWAGSFRAGQKAERARGGRAYAVYLAGAGLALALAFALGGWAGLALWLALAAHAQMQILLSDYVQHYGLVRSTGPGGRPEPVGPRHSWNAGHWASSALMLNATRHSDHHCHPMRPYPALSLPEDAPRLPWPLPVAACVALFPPLWHRRMRRRLADRSEPNER